MLNPEAIPIINDIAENLYNKIKLRLSYDEEVIQNNVPEYIAYLILHAIEWDSPSIEYNRYIANHLVGDLFSLPVGTSGILKRYFDLPY